MTSWHHFFHGKEFDSCKFATQKEIKLRVNYRKKELLCLTRFFKKIPLKPEII